VCAMTTPPLPLHPRPRVPAPSLAPPRQTRSSPQRPQPSMLFSFFAPRRRAVCAFCLCPSAVPTCSSKSLRECSLRVRVRCLDRDWAQIVGTALVHLPAQQASSTPKDGTPPMRHVDPPNRAGRARRLRPGWGCGARSLRPPFSGGRSALRRSVIPPIDLLYLYT